MSSDKIIFVVGPTAVGKTKIAVFLARKLKGEIVSCDAMQVYKEISIATCKPDQKTLDKVPHHLINTVSIKQEFDVVMFSRKAGKVIRDIQGRGKIPVVVGGSGLYMSVLLDGIFKGPPSDERLRQKLMNQAEKKGRHFLHDQLKKIDPVSAKKIHVNDLRRTIRALEVFKKEKRPMSELKKQRDGLWGKQDITIFALNRKREELYGLINRRVDRMFKDGVVDEIKKLMRRKWSFTSDGIIAVKEIKGFLRGEHDLERAQYLIKLNTRHYAKRQLTWFRKDTRVTWVNIKKNDTLAQVAAKMLKKVKK